MATNHERINAIMDCLRLFTSRLAQLAELIPPSYLDLENMGVYRTNGGEITLMFSIPFRIHFDAHMAHIVLTRGNGLPDLVESIPLTLPWGTQKQVIVAIASAWEQALKEPPQKAIK